MAAGNPYGEGHFSGDMGRDRACPTLIYLTLFAREQHVAMRPLAIINIATCHTRALVTVRVANKHTCTMFGGVPLRSMSGYLAAKYCDGRVYVCLSVRSMSGYLAAFSAAESPVGSTECPWLLDIRPGQHADSIVTTGKLSEMYCYSLESRLARKPNF